MQLAQDFEPLEVCDQEYQIDVVLSPLPGAKIT